MPAQPQPSPPTTAALNAMPLNQHVLELMKQEHVSPDPGLAVVALLLWAQTNMDEVDPNWLETVVGLAARAEMDDPEALMENLEDAAPEILKATTLAGAAMALLQLMADLIPQD